LSTPDAATIMKIANTCGTPHTTWLFIPVMTWPDVSIACAARKPASATAPPRKASAQKPRASRRE
jgi:hypothetical protein